MLDEKTIHERLQKANRERGYSVKYERSYCNYWEVSRQYMQVVIIQPEGKAKYISEAN